MMEMLKIPFEVIPSGFDEDSVKEEDPYKLALNLAARKAETVFKENQDAVVLGCDTLALFGGKIIGKPKDAKDAVHTLKALRDYDGCHELISGVAIVSKDEIKSFVSVSKVRFKKSVTDAQIEEYVATGEPLDKAGSYAILANGDFLTEKIEGSLFNIAGMPLYDVANELAEIGFEIEDRILEQIRRQEKVFSPKPEFPLGESGLIALLPIKCF